MIHNFIFCLKYKLSNYCAGFEIRVRVTVYVDSYDLVWIFTGDSRGYNMSPGAGVDAGVGEVDRTVPPGVHIVQLMDVLQTVQGQTHGDLSWKYVYSIQPHLFNITFH